VSVGIDDSRHIAVFGRKGSTPWCQKPLVPQLPFGRDKRLTSKMVAKDKRRHGFKHRYFYGLTLTCAFSVQQRPEDNVYRGLTCGSVRNNYRHISWGSVSRLSHQRRHAARSLNQIIVGGPPGILSCFSIPEH